MAQGSSGWLLTMAPLSWEDEHARGRLLDGGEELVGGSWHNEGDKRHGEAEVAEELHRDGNQMGFALSSTPHGG
jgi:hypothetical protein